MQFIFFVPPHEKLEGTLHPQHFGCTPKNEGKRVHVPQMKKTCGHTGFNLLIQKYHGKLLQIYTDASFTKLAVELCYILIIFTKLELFVVF